METEGLLDLREGKREENTFFVVVSLWSKHCKKTGTDFIQNKGALPPPHKRKGRSYLKLLKMQEKKLFNPRGNGQVKMTTGAPKYLQRAELQLFLFPEALRKPAGLPPATLVLETDEGSARLMAGVLWLLV